MIATDRTASFWLFGSAFFALACATQGTSVPVETTPVSGPPPPTASASVESPTVAPPTAETAPTPATGEARAAAAAPPVSSPQKAPPRTERDCKACNGDWGIHGISPTPSCNCRTTDGGKRCKDGTECQGLCTAADDPEREVTDPGPPTRGFFVGRCSRFSTVFGCYRPIDDGAGSKPADLTEPPQMICAD
jgi:hypothetical protein